MNRFATHMPVLLACLRYTTGPVLEFGSGFYSTSVLSALSTERVVRTIEADLACHNRIAPFMRDHHQLCFVRDYDDAPISDYEWSVVLIDHGPPERRVIDLKRVRDKAQMVVCHDTEALVYGYEPVFETFAHTYAYKGETPWTTVVSDKPFPFKWLHEMLE